MVIARKIGAWIATAGLLTAALAMGGQAAADGSRRAKAQPVQDTQQRRLVRRRRRGQGRHLLVRRRHRRLQPRHLQGRLGAARLRQPRRLRPGADRRRPRLAGRRDARLPVPPHAASAAASTGRRLPELQALARRSHHARARHRVGLQGGGRRRHVGRPARSTSRWPAATRRRSTATGRRARIGHNRNRVIYGIEGQAFGNEDFNAQRLGGFLTFQVPLRPSTPLEVTLAAGHQFVNEFEQQRRLDQHRRRRGHLRHDRVQHDVLVS